MSAPGSSHGQETGRGHQPGAEHLVPAPSDTQRSPQEIERIREQKARARAAAEQAYARMGLSPGLADLLIGFNDNGQVFEMGMSLEKAIKAILTGGNRCRLQGSPEGEKSYRLEIITKDSRRLTFEAQAGGKYLLIGGLTMTKPGRGPTLQAHGPKAAFYLMTFMRGM